MDELPEGYHFANGPELLAIKHFPVPPGSIVRPRPS